MPRLLMLKIDGIIGSTSAYHSLLYSYTGSYVPTFWMVKLISDWESPVEVWSSIGGVIGKFRVEQDLWNLPSGMAEGIPEPLHMLGFATAFMFWGVFRLSLVSSIAIRLLHSVSKAKTREVALPCMGYKGEGFYTIVDLFQGNASIE